MNYTEYFDKVTALVTDSLKKASPPVQDIHSLPRTNRRTTRVTYHNIDWKVSGIYTPGHAAVYYMRNGDPGYPEEPSDLYDVSIEIYTKNGWSDDMQDVLDDEIIDKLIDLALEEMDSNDEVCDIPF